MEAEVTAWRRARRAELLAARTATDPATRRRWGAAIERRLARVLRAQPPGILGFYWPFRGEFDPRPLVEALLAEGWRAALPVVLKPREPLEYRLWTPGSAMASGVWDIPIPADGAVTIPDIVLAPLVGFDAAGYRLGYGGGFFDRTLASLVPRPRAIGVGFEQGRLATIHPAPHDQPMDLIVTEAEPAA